MKDVAEGAVFGLLVGLFVFGVRAMTAENLRPESAQQALLAQGYRSVSMGAECSLPDAVRCYHFEAVTYDGRYVSGGVKKRWAWAR